MNKPEADELAKKAATDFINSYFSLLKTENYPSARALMLTTFPTALSLISPSRRSQALADLFDIFYMIGQEVFEDADDLFTKLATFKVKEE